MPCMTIHLRRLDRASVRMGAALRVPGTRHPHISLLRLVTQAFAAGSVIGLATMTGSHPSTWSVWVLGVFCLAYLLLNFELDRP
jgi:hypothetical protein